MIGIPPEMGCTKLFSPLGNAPAFRRTNLLGIKVEPLLNWCKGQPGPTGGAAQESRDKTTTTCTPSLLSQTHTPSESIHRRGGTSDTIINPVSSHRLSPRSTHFPFLAKKQLRGLPKTQPLYHAIILQILAHTKSK